MTDRDPLTVTFEEFSAMPFNEKAALSEAFRNAHDDKVQEAFDAGASWVMFCGSSEPAMTAGSFSNIPSEEEIKDYATRKNAAPYLYMRPVEIDCL